MTTKLLPGDSSPTLGMGLALSARMDLDWLRNIQIVDRDRICPFEWSPSSDHESDLSLSDIRFVRHPLLATALGDGYLLLEGRRDFDALAGAGLRHFPLQVASPESISLETNRLGLVGYTLEHLVQVAAKYSEQILIERNPREKPNPSGYLPVAFDFEGESVRGYLRHSSRTGCPLSLDHLMQSILRRGRYDRIIESTVTPGATGTVTRSGSYSASLALPDFSLSDLVRAAESDHLFPPNLIQATANCRVLNMDFPMSVLADDTGVKDKEAFFRELVNIRAQSHKVSVFDGRVYVLNH